MKRGEIWIINLDPTIGAEIKKRRPAILVNVDSLGILPLKVIVPLTDWKERYSVADWMVKIVKNATNNLIKDSAADCFQVRSLSEKRMLRKIGEIKENKMHELEESLAKVLGIK